MEDIGVDWYKNIFNDSYLISELLYETQITLLEIAELIFISKMMLTK